MEDIHNKDLITSNKGSWNSEKPTGTYITTSEAVDMNQAKGIYPGKTITQKTRQSKITVITLQP